MKDEIEQLQKEAVREYMILYEDKDIIVCHKAAGIPVQSARIGQKDMVSILNNHLADQRMEAAAKADLMEKKRKGWKDGNKQEMIHVVHRLDQPVEGVIVFAKNQKAAAGLSGQITDGSMKKTYQAVCCVTDRVREQLELETGKCYQLVDYLKKDGKTNTSSVVKQGDRDAKRAELTFTILQMEDEKYLLAKVDLKTGRHHQIRVQMAHAGLPLYGDQKYHDSWEEYLLRDTQEKDVVLNSERFGKKKTGTGLALCAVALSFRHPVTGKLMTFETVPETEVFQKMKHLAEYRT
jgi:23S rRNA pseudouridine1911/1915/1917 synthase